MTKANKRIKGSFLKATKKQTEVKERKYFKGEGVVSSYGAQKICKRKAGKFLKGNNSFFMSQEKQKVVITQKKLF